jgi:Tol biopolymer transport system component
LSWSSKGELAFITDSDIVILDPNTSIETILVSGSELGERPTSLAWSPLGDRLAFALPVSDGGMGAAGLKLVSRIYTADRSGGNIRRIGSPDMCPGVIDCYSEFSPNWSPDGTQIAFFVEGFDADMNVKGLWVMDSNGSNRKKIWTDEDSCCQLGKLSWSPTKIP